MRALVTLIIFCLLAISAQADELETAYKKEYAYLVAEKQALEKRLQSLAQSNETSMDRVASEIDQLQKQYLSKQNQVDRLNQLILEGSRNANFNENDALLLETTLLQARESLEKSDILIDQGQEQDQQLSAAFANAIQLIARDGKVFERQGAFFTRQGELTEGKIFHAGRIARYGVSDPTAGDQSAGALAPAGEGQFKVWDATTAQTARLLADNKRPEVLDVLLFDDPGQAMEMQDEKSFREELEAGGLIAKIILGLGVLGAALVLLRVIYLLMFSSDTQKITAKVNQEMQSGNLDNALEICKSKMSSASRVVAATLRNLDRDRDHIEDVISESILYESSRIDRFGSLIVVIAAISPLLGLLGTVTGMISTFDIITEFGTGDPKLLSGGISEALLTTKFGLVVAIPLLLLGNMLSSWGNRTKNDLERAALHMINTHKTSYQS
jgi:biopolymer transport protein ExbB